jgi:hypothetical protein
MVGNNSVSLDALVTFKMASVSVQIPGHLHDSRREAVPHCCLSHLVTGQVLFDLNHSVTFVEGRSHVQNHGPGLQASGSLIVCNIDPIHAAVKGKLLEHGSHYLHWVRLRGEAQVSPQLLHPSKEERGRMAAILSRTTRSLVIGPLLLEGVPLREDPRVAVIKHVDLL